MIIYACDSTAKAASVALCDGEKLLAQYTQNGGNTHSETLMPMTGTMLKSMHMTVDDIDVFACSAGPGSFTGVRIGVATVKGLAFGKGKPCVGVSALEALAMNLCDGYDSLICPVMDARRGQFYTALFRCSGGVLTRLRGDCVIPVGEIYSMISEYGGPIRFTGDGYSLVTAGKAVPGFIPTPEVLRHQSAYSVAQTALKAVSEGHGVPESELRPVYLRLPQAERERLEREKAKQEV